MNDCRTGSGSNWQLLCFYMEKHWKSKQEFMYYVYMCLVYGDRGYSGDVISKNTGVLSHSGAKNVQKCQKIQNFVLRTQFFN